MQIDIYYRCVHVYIILPLCGCLVVHKLSSSRYVSIKPITPSSQRVQSLNTGNVVKQWVCAQAREEATAEAIYGAEPHKFWRSAMLLAAFRRAPWCFYVFSRLIDSLNLLSFVTLVVDCTWKTTRILYGIEYATIWSLQVKPEPCTLGHEEQLSSWLRLGVLFTNVVYCNWLKYILRLHCCLDSAFQYSHMVWVP